MLFLLADAAEPMEFECGVDEYGPRRDVMPMGVQPPTSTADQVTDCVEVAIEIDLHTYGTFGNVCYPAVEWALAIMAGVSTIYTKASTPSSMCRPRTSTCGKPPTRTTASPMTLTHARHLPPRVAEQQQLPASSATWCTCSPAGKHRNRRHPLPRRGVLPAYAPDSART